MRCKTVTRLSMCNMVETSGHFEGGCVVGTVKVCIKRIMDHIVNHFLAENVATL